MITTTPVRVEVDGSETILEGLHRQGRTMDAPCRSGGCGVCRVKVLAGAVFRHGPHTRRALSEEDEQHGLALACRATPFAGAVVVQPLSRNVRNRFGHWSVSYGPPASTQRKRNEL